MSNSILASEHSPNSIAIELIITIELELFHVGIFVDQILRYLKLLNAIDSF